jgi:hypothetical protein
MLSNPSQYLPQGWGSQFSGIQGFGSPQMSVGPFGQAFPFGGNASGYDLGQVGAGQQQYPFGGQSHPFAQNPYAQQQQNPYAQQQNPFAAFATHPYAGALHPGQQILPALAQLAQQIAVQSAVTQQIGAALHQLVQQLAIQGTQGQQGFQQGFGLGSGQPFAGLNPQAQAWGANRSPTIQ